MSSEMSPLFKLALASGRVEIVKLHLARGADVNARDSSGASALLLAASRGRKDVCEILLKHGADPTAMDSVGRTLTHYALQWGFELPSADLLERREPYVSPQSEREAEEQDDPNGLPELKSHLQPHCIASGSATEPVLIQLEAKLGVGFEEIQAPSAEEGWGPSDGLSEWESDPEPTAPVEDLVRAAAAKAAHDHFSRAAAFTDSSDWSCIEVALPTSLTPNITVLPSPIHSMLTESIRNGWVSVGDVREALRLAKLSESYVGPLRVIIAELGIELRSSLFEELLEAQAPEALTQHADLERLAEATELLGVLLGPDDETKYLIEVRALRKDAVSIQPLLWTRVEELRRRAASAFASMHGGIAFLEAAGALFDSDEEDPADFDDDLSEENADEKEASCHAPREVERETKHLFSNLSAMSNSEVVDRLTTIRLPLTVMQKAAKIAVDSDAVGAGELANIVDELSHRLDRLVETNLGLVTWFANRYRNRGLDYLDLVQEGNIGLMKAVQKFDPSRGSALATYAIWWIRQSITRAISDLGRTIRLPVHVQERARKIQRIRETLLSELGRCATPQEIASRIEMSEEGIARLERIIGRLMPVGRDNVERIPEKIIRETADLAEGPEETMWTKKVSRALLDLLQVLTPRQERILRMRFGIGLDVDHTLEEVGATFGVTRERIRQIEAKALRRLAHPAQSKRLRGVLGVQ